MDFLKKNLRTGDSETWTSCLLRPRFSCTLCCCGSPPPPPPPPCTFDSSQAAALSLTHELCVGQSWTNRQTSLRLHWHCPQLSKHQHLSSLPWNLTRDGKSYNLHLWTDFLKTRQVNSLQAALSLTQRKAHDRSLLPRPTATFTLDRELSTSIFSRYLCKSPWMILTDNFCWFQNVRMQGLDKVIPIYRSSFPESNNSVGVLEGRIFCTLCNCAENTFPLACWILWTLLCMQKKSSWIE